MATRVVKVDRLAVQRATGPLGIQALAKGLGVTSKHFFRNLFGWIRGKPTVATVMFPEEDLVKPPAFRGMPVLVQMDNGKERCVACGLCEWAFPVDCIYIVPAETEDAIERYPEVFDIDMSRCILRPLRGGVSGRGDRDEQPIRSRRSRRATLWHKKDLLMPSDQLPRRPTTSA
jgi:NADH-quinone oxidoreductase subunit I